MSTQELPWRPNVPSYKVRVTVVKAHPECGAKHKVGDTFEMIGVRKEHVKGFMCPTAFATFYPMIYALRYGGEFPWAKDPDSWVGCCPDIDTPVLFEIRRLRDDKRIADEESKPTEG